MASDNTKILLTKKRPEKGLLSAMKSKGGRNNAGRVTARHQGGGVKKRYRMVEFGQKSIGEKAKVIALEYDPNRTCFIALVESENGQKAYILAPHNLKIGQEVLYSTHAPLNIGNRMKLKNIPVGTFVFNIELTPGGGGVVARSAGVAVQIMGHEGKYSQVKMPSGEVRKILGECFASIGALSNPEHRFHSMGKAGIARKKGIRPSVRGSAMNACDHPHGGGKNKQPIGKHPRTAWGKPALGVKTRNPRKWTNKLIVKRRSR